MPEFGLIENITQLGKLVLYLSLSIPFIIVFSVMCIIVSLTLFSGVC